MLIIIGASASGKTEISKILKKQFGYEKCITTTTRQMRLGEVNHRDYHFISKNEFIELIEKKRFVEYTEYQNNYYGINKQDVIKDAVVVVEPSGANALIDNGDDVFIVLIASNKEQRKQRMIKRGDNIESIESRLLLDDERFNKAKIKRVDLYIENNDHDITDVAKVIDEKYRKRKTCK